MARGKRAGFVKKADLLKRLRARFAGAELALSGKTSALQLLGHAVYHNVVTEREAEETVDRSESTLPCYLRTHVAEGLERTAIERYVVAASQLYHRGAAIANVMAMLACGSRHPGAGDASVPVWRPRYQADAQPSPGQAALIELLFVREGAGEEGDGGEDATGAATAAPQLKPADVRSTPFKQVFLPERWPTQGVPRHPSVQGAMDAMDDACPAAPAWQDVCAPTGWDNAINRMATKYFANVQVHVTTGIVEAAADYVKVAPLDAGTPAQLLAELVSGRPRPLAACNDDWDMAWALRSALLHPDNSDVTWYPEKRPPFSEPLFRLHLFLARYGLRERSYLPAVGRGRKYCYLDAKIAKALFAQARRQRQKGARGITAKAGKDKPLGKQSKPGASSAAGPSTASLPGEDSGDAGGDGDGPEDEAVTQSLGELLGITPGSFNQQRRALRRRLRKQHRQACRRETDAQKRARLRKLERRWSRLGCGKMAQHVRIDSLETDGVGLRLCLKTKVHLAPYVVPVPLATAATKVEAKKARTGRKPGRGGPASEEKKEEAEKVERRRLAENGPLPPGFAPVDPCDASAPRPIIVAVDKGRAKPFVAAISRNACAKPTTAMFTRRRYYWEMHHRERLRWEERRMAAAPHLGAILGELAASGGTRNCNLDTWLSCLAVQKAHEATLDAEYVQDDQRALWRMRMFRWKRASLDRASHGLFRQATFGEAVDRPLVLAVGSAGFAATGRGELAAPTAAVSAAFARSLAKERAKGRRVWVFNPSEHRTTLCCCACGAVTQPPLVAARATRGVEAQPRRSRRLRLCTECQPDAKRRDRDVQAARNILWVGIALYYGLERPEYLKRYPAQKKCAEGPESTCSHA